MTKTDKIKKLIELLVQREVSKQLNEILGSTSKKQMVETPKQRNSPIKRPVPTKQAPKFKNPMLNEIFSTVKLEDELDDGFDWKAEAGITDSIYKNPSKPPAVVKQVKESFKGHVNPQASSILDAMIKDYSGTVKMMESKKTNIQPSYEEDLSFLDEVQ
jgi:hypothetical protein